MSCGKTVSTHGNFGKNKNDNNKLKCIYCNSFRLLSKKKEHTNSLRQSYQTDSKSLSKFFRQKNIIRSFLCFLPAFFPSFIRQRTSHHLRKKRPNLTRTKFRQAFRDITNYFIICLLKRAVES